MELGEVEILKERSGVSLQKIGASGGREVFWVIGNGSSLCFQEDYDDALDEFNLRWMKEEFGE